MNTQRTARSIGSFVRDTPRMDRASYNRTHASLWTQSFLQSYKSPVQCHGAGSYFSGDVIFAYCLHLLGQGRLSEQHGRHERRKHFGPLPRHVVIV